MYHSTDPRAALATTPAGAKPAATHFAGAEYAKFYETPPAETQNGARTWYARGQNFIIAYSDAEKGAVLSRTSQPDEYVVLLPDPGAGAEITWGNERTIVSGHSISFVPAGASAVALLGAAKLVRMMTTRSEDLARLCSNAASYAKPHPNLPPFEPWPEAAGGRKVRTYSLDVAAAPGRLSLPRRPSPQPPPASAARARSRPARRPSPKCVRSATSRGIAAHRRVRPWRNCRRRGCRR